MINVEVLRVLSARGAGDVLLRKFSVFLNNNPDYVMDEICNNQQLMCSLGIRQDVSRNIFQAKEKAVRLEEQLKKSDVGMWWLGAPDYPQRLRALEGSKMITVPSVLFYKGNTELLYRKSVGFTGSRKVSESGIRITAEAVRQLIKSNISIVSGYAKGVDLTAHRMALAEGGDTVFVIVEGILKNRIKSDVKELLNDKNHIFISQAAPELSWSAANAMKRNNTIIGLSDVMFLIEAGMTGGTFAAGEQSLKCSKPLFVVDYAVQKPSAEGNPYFIEKGGVPIRGDKNGIPILKKIYSVLESKDEIEECRQMSLNEIMSP